MKTLKLGCFGTIGLLFAIVIIVALLPKPAKADAGTPMQHIHLPFVTNAPVSKAQYRQQLKALVVDYQKWTKDLNSLFGVGLTTTSPKWIAGLSDLKRRADDFAVRMGAMQPPYGYISATKLMINGNEACTDAIEHFQAAKFGFAQLSLSVCAMNFTAAQTRIP